MDSALTSVGLPLALGLVMFGLGLSLTVADFTRIARAPKAVAIALVCQIVLLPLVAFGLVRLFDLPWQLGVGMMLLAASPGGTTASLFSHLFRGDVALNISLTAINTVIAVVTLPLITSLAINYSGGEGRWRSPFWGGLRFSGTTWGPAGAGWRGPAASTGGLGGAGIPVGLGTPAGMQE